MGQSPVRVLYSLADECLRMQIEVMVGGLSSGEKPLLVPLWYVVVGVRLLSRS